MLASLRTKFLLPTFLRFFSESFKKDVKVMFFEIRKKRKIRILEHCSQGRRTWLDDVPACSYSRQCSPVRSAITATAEFLVLFKGGCYEPCYPAQTSHCIAVSK